MSVLSLEDLKKVCAEHPRFKERVLPAEVEQRVSAEAVREYYDAVSDAIALEEADPLRQGFEPEIWRKADEELRKFREAHPVGVLIFVVLGGIRSSKTEWRSKRTVEAMLTKRAYKVWASHSTQESSREAQQSKINRYIPPEYKSEKGRLRIGNQLKVNYTPWGGFTEDTFAFPSNAGGVSECRFKFYSMNPRSLEGAEIDEGWLDEQAAMEWLNAYIGRAATRNGIVFLTFAAIDGYTPLVRALLDGATTLEETEARLLPVRKQKKIEFGNQEARKGTDSQDLSGGVESRHAGEERALQHSGSRSLAENDEHKGADPRVSQTQHSGSSAPPAQKNHWDSSTTLGMTEAFPHPGFLVSELTPSVTYQKVPRVQENLNVMIASGEDSAMRLKAKARIVYFHTSDNPYGNPEALAATLEGASEEKIKMMFYGVPTRAISSQFNYKDSVHTMSTSTYRALVERLGMNTGARYLLIDPCSGRNWFMLWIWCWAPQCAIIYREWPSTGHAGAFIEGMADPGPWAVPGKSPDGDRGEAQRPFRFGYDRYVEEIAKAEGWWRGNLAESIAQMRNTEERIMARLIDGRYAVSPTQVREGAVTLIQQLSEIGMDCVAMTGERKILSGESDGSVETINRALAYDEKVAIGEFSPDLARINEPRLQVVETCTNTKFALETWTGRDGAHGACKDPIDCVRGFYLSELDYVDEAMMKPRLPWLEAVRR